MLSLEQTRFTDHNKLSPSGNTWILQLNVFAKQGLLPCFIYSMIAPYVCVCALFTVGLRSRFPERLHVFYMAVNCEWAQVRACVGVVELPAGPGPSTDKLFTNRLSIPELGSTRSPLILTSHLPSNTEEDRGGHLQREAEGG